MPDWGEQKCSYNILNNCWNRTFTVFWIHTTFQYLRLRNRKQFELYLSLTGFRLQILLFLWVSSSFARACWIQHLVPMLDLSKLKILLQISLMHASLFGTKILSTNHSTFLLPLPGQIPPPNWPWLLPFQQTKVQRVQLAYPFSPLPLQWSVPAFQFFLIPVDLDQEG